MTVFYYFITSGENGPLFSKGFQSTEVSAGSLPGGLFLHPGVPGTNYTNKSSEFDIWDSHKLAWVTNPNEAQEVALKLQYELEEAKQAKKTEFKAQRDAIEFGPFQYDGMWFDGDVDAQRRLGVLVSASKAAISAGYSFSKEFTLANDSEVTLSAEDFVGIEMAKLWQVEAAFQEYREKRSLIEAATTLEELEAICPV